MGTNSLISVRAGLAGQSKHMAKPPKAAIGRCIALQESGPRSQERRSQSTRVGIVTTCKEAASEEFNGSPVLQGAERHARFLARAADAGYRDCSCRGAKREAESHACTSILASLPRALMPNPSLKRSANGRPPGPGLRYSVHFLSPGPGVLPLSPA